MKKVAVLLILFGSGLTAFGISGFYGGVDPNTNLIDPNVIQSPLLYLSLGWPMPERVEIAVGVLSLAGGLILRKDSD
jgi:uncharacterized membrane protein YphA (DoxX/SURF4 family)